MGRTANGQDTDRHGRRAPKPGGWGKRVVAGRQFIRDHEVIGVTCGIYMYAPGASLICHSSPKCKEFLRSTFNPTAHCISRQRGIEYCSL